MHDPFLLWFEEVLSPVAPFSVMAPPTVTFEQELDPVVLNEHPRVTAIDFFVETSDAVICTEVKWAEEGLGRCGCGAPRSAVGDCATRVLERPAYWNAAQEVFFLPKRVDGQPCSISVAYQAIRNVAAARALAAGREPVFVLLYDATNPYFKATGSWPGWPEMLRATLADADKAGLVRFRPVSWQDLVSKLPLSGVERTWARIKHGLEDGWRPRLPAMRCALTSWLGRRGLTRAHAK